jgi:stress-induced morphogen
MATIARGPRDETVERVRSMLDEYERLNPGSVATLYRQNSASIRIKIIDGRFAGWSKGKRHDEVWKFIADKLSDDEIQEISMLLLLAPDELRTSFMNAEFEDPVRSQF